MRPAPQILDCTLRDGSYAINFQFSKAETARIAGRLDELGFPLIEIGHGIGLGASEKGMGIAAASDQDYMQAAATVVKDNLWGMFCIPGIATLDHLDLAADNGMGFVRIGCEVESASEAVPFIQKARRLGMRVYSNLMKSYAVAPDYFADQARICWDAGAECIYVVDSAGGMLPSELVTLTERLRNGIDGVKLGFHGHHNLGLGVANALACADLGYEVVDSSLQGFGRSAGNTPTEQLVAVLVRAGYDVPHDPVDVMQAAEELIRPMIRTQGISSLDVTAGLALFHSSYMPRVMGVAQSHRIDPRRLIIAACKENKASAPMDLLERCARTVHESSPNFSGRIYDLYYGEEQK